MLALLAALTLLATPAAPPGRTWTASDEVVLNDLIRDRLDALGSHVYRATRQRIHVTSGVRSPRRQALAMYMKLQAGGSLGIYARQDLVRPILDAWRTGKRKRWGKDRTVAAMAEVIAAQVQRGQFISRHLSGRAFDLRSTGIGRKVRTALRAALREVGNISMIEEKRPPHFHLEIRLPPTAEDPDDGPSEIDDEKPERKASDND